MKRHRHLFTAVAAFSLLLSGVATGTLPIYGGVRVQMSSSMFTIGKA